MDSKSCCRESRYKSSDFPPTFALNTASGNYVISYTDGHEGGDWAQIQNAERDSIIPAVKGKVLQEKEVLLAGYRGKSYTFEGNIPPSGPVTGELRMYFNGHRFYMLFAVAPKGSNGEGATKFIGSFQLVAAANHQ